MVSLDPMRTRSPRTPGTPHRCFVQALRVVVAVFALTAVLWSGPAAASWTRPSQLTFNTAHTLERGVFEVGLLSPLQYGVADGLQLSIHPLLTLVGVPNVGVRWRITPSTDKVAVALNVGAIWSFLPQEHPTTHITSDNAMQVLTTVTVSWAVTREVMLSIGVGPSVEYDFIGDVGLAAEIHGSLLWLLDADQLLMLHVEGYVNIAGPDPGRSPVVQFMYARACGSTHVGVGVAIGDFPLARAFDRTESWVLYPLIDLWWRL